jgi:hypothetical protein
MNSLVQPFMALHERAREQDESTSFSIQGEIVSDDGNWMVWQDVRWTCRGVYGAPVHNSLE